MARDFGPGIAFIQRRKHGTRVSSEIQAWFLLVVHGHCLPQNGEKTVVCRQSRLLCMPTCPAIAGGPDRGGCVYRVAPRAIAVQREGPEHIGVARVHSDGKAKGRRQSFGDILPGSCPVQALVHAVVVLLVKDEAVVRECDLHVVHAATDFRIGAKGGVV